MNDNKTYASIIKDLLVRFIDYPDDLVVEESGGETLVIINISTKHPTDIAKIIGKGGKVITSLDNIIYRISSKNKQKCRLNVLY